MCKYNTNRKYHHIKSIWNHIKFGCKKSEKNGYNSEFVFNFVTINLTKGLFNSKLIFI